MLFYLIWSLWKWPLVTCYWIFLWNITSINRSMPFFKHMGCFCCAPAACPEKSWAKERPVKAPQEKLPSMCYGIPRCNDPKSSGDEEWRNGSTSCVLSEGPWVINGISSRGRNGNPNNLGQPVLHNGLGMTCGHYENSRHRLPLCWSNITT